MFILCVCMCEMYKCEFEGISSKIILRILMDFFNKNNRCMLKTTQHFHTKSMSHTKVQWKNTILRILMDFFRQKQQMYAQSNTVFSQKACHTYTYENTINIPQQWLLKGHQCFHLMEVQATILRILLDFQTLIPSNRRFDLEAKLMTISINRYLIFFFLNIYKNSSIIFFL